MSNQLLVFSTKEHKDISFYETHSSQPSLQTANVWDMLEYHGFKNPRLFALSGIASFRRPHLYIIMEKIKRLEDANMNSRGLLSLRFYNVRILMASERREVK